MKRFILFTALFCFIGVGGAWAQYGFGTNNPDQSAVVDIFSISKGLLIPNVALTATNEAGPVTSPANSLLVYNTATAGTSPNNVTPGYYYWNTSSSKWFRLSTQGSTLFSEILGGTNVTAAMLVGTGASLAPTGSGTIQANLFVGTGSTTDAIDLATGEVAGELPLANIANSATNNQFLVTNASGATEWMTLNLTTATFSGNGIGTALNIANDGITAAMINADVAGAGLVPNGTTGALDVNADNSTIEINLDALRVKASGITANEIATGAVASDEILNGSIINEDINASAAIAGTKISPDFGAQVVTTSGNISATGSGALSVGGISTLSGDVTVGTGTFLYGTADPDLFVEGNLEVLGNIYGTIVGAMSYTLTDGAGIADFEYDGSAAKTVALDYTYANTWTGIQTFATAAHLVTSSLDPSGSGTITANKFITAASSTDAVDLATTEVNGILPDANVDNTLTITAGSINGTPIGNSSANTGAFTTLSASSTVTFTGISSTSDTEVLTISGSGVLHKQALSNISSYGNIVTKTTNYTATSTDGTIIVDASGGNVTITLPAASSSAGLRLSVKKTDSSSNSVILDANGAETIDGQTTMSWNVIWQGFIIQCNGSSWYIVGKI